MLINEVPSTNVNHLTLREKSLVILHLPGYPLYLYKAIRQYSIILIFSLHGSQQKYLS